MNRLHHINAALLAMSSSISAFVSLTTSSSSTRMVSARGNQALHMSAPHFSSFGEWDLPEDLPDGYDDTSLMEVPPQRFNFLHGDNLQRLRRQVMLWRGELHDAQSCRDTERTLEIQHSIIKAQQQDAEFVYAIALERMEAAETRGWWVEADQFRNEAAIAREALPHFNLDGLWVGKYGNQGFEMINVTYVGDTLHAYKVTGDRNVPKGQISFSVDLSPTRIKDHFLEPIELGEAAARQWGAKFLSRFRGKGQVAGEGYTNAQFVEGQLILVNDFFSFAWVPLGHQVFFGRPSAELMLKLLRESEQPNAQSDIDKARAHLTRCMEETLSLEDDDVEEIVATSQQKFYGIDGYFD